MVEGGKVLTRNLSHLEIDDGREEGAMAPATYLTLAWLEFSLSEKLPGSQTEIYCPSNPLFSSDVCYMHIKPLKVS